MLVTGEISCSSNAQDKAVSLIHVFTGCGTSAPDQTRGELNQETTNNLLFCNCRDCM